MRKHKNGQHKGGRLGLRRRLARDFAKAPGWRVVRQRVAAVLKNYPFDRTAEDVDPVPAGNAIPAGVAAAAAGHARIEARKREHQMEREHDPERFDTTFDLQACRECGCTELNACTDEELGPCWWVAEDLCSHCQRDMEGGLPL